MTHHAIKFPGDKMIVGDFSFVEHARLELATS